MSIKFCSCFLIKYTCLSLVDFNETYIRRKNLALRTVSGCISHKALGHLLQPQWHIFLLLLYSNTSIRTWENAFFRKLPLSFLKHSNFSPQDLLWARKVLDRASWTWKALDFLLFFQCIWRSRCCFWKTLSDPMGWKSTRKCQSALVLSWNIRVL